MERNYPIVAFLERRIVTLYGLNSNAMKALDHVRKVMCIEKDFIRDDGSDYYIHCVEVANTLLSYGIRDEDIICAALLHDIIEDVEGYTRLTIEELFNTNIANLVDLLTKKHNVDYHDPENLMEYIAGIKSDANASAIKAADRMHNMMTLDNKTFENRYKKAMETKKYYLPFFNECLTRYTRYENLFYAAKSQIEPLIFTIEAFYAEICRLRGTSEVTTESSTQTTVETAPEVTS